MPSQEVEGVTEHHYLLRQMVGEGAGRLLEPGGVHRPMAVARSLGSPFRRPSGLPRTPLLPEGGEGVRSRRPPPEG